MPPLPEELSTSDGQLGYLLTMPQTLQAGAEEQFCLTLHGITNDQVIALALYEPTADVSVEYKHTYVNGESQCNTFQVPAKPGTYEVQLQNETDVFTVSKVKVEGKNLITFVQTDKPIYKPGQTVKFRILTMKRDLRSRVGKIQEVYVIDPNDFKVKQFKDVDSQGMANLEFQLISEAKLGTWQIQVTVDGEQTTQTFKVEEYVLPRFEVTIEPPSYFLVTSELIEGNVCAKYTYGKPVKGTLTLNICTTGYGSFGEPCRRVVEELDGCVPFSVNATEVISAGRYLYGRSLSFDASVREADTGFQVNATKEGPQITYDPIKITFSDSTSGYFKPGFPIHGMVKVELPDGSPAVAETIRITASDNSNDVYQQKVFNTSENGEIYYSICQGIMDHTSSLSLSAVAENYQTDEYGSIPHYRRLYQPRASGSFQQWFSPSLSYIQIPALQHPVQCQEEMTLRVPYTHSGTKPYIKFYYQVMSRGRIVHSGQVESPTISDPLSHIEAQLDTCLEIAERPTYSPPRPPEPEVEPKTDNSSEIAPTPEEPTVGEPIWEEEPMMVAELPLEPRQELPLGEEPTRPTTLPTIAVPTRKSKAQSPTKKPKIPAPTKKPKVTRPNVESTRSDNELLGADAEEGQIRIKRSFAPNPGIDDAEPIKRSEELSQQVSSVDITIPVTAEMSPKFSLLVYYIRDDGETVADSMEFNVEPCFDNKVKMEFTEESVLPGTETNIRLEAAPGSVCGVGVVDKSVNILGGDHQITPEKVFEKLAEYSLSSHGSYQYFRSDNDYCKQKLKDKQEEADDDDDDDDEEPTFYYDFWYRSRFVDAIQAFKQMGLLVLTNLVLETRPCSRQVPIYYAAIPMTLSGGMPGPPGISSVLQHIPGPRGSKQDSSEGVDLRMYFPETWLWELEIVGETGTADLTRTIPHTITRWVGNSICMSDQAGFGLSPMSAITTFQPFFLSFNLPYNAVRGERLPITVTVYNYLDKCLHMMLQVDGMKGFKVHNARATRDPFCLCGGQSRTTKFFITAQDIGKLPIFAQAEIIPGQCDNDVIMDTQYIGRKDAVQREILVKAEGVTQQYSHSLYICPKDNEVYSSTVGLPLPADIVADSARGDVTVIGDMMGPALSNLDGLVRMPTGCGEQNMVGFTPNIYVLKYLTATGRLDEVMQDKAKTFMETGYQRELKYRHSDGSYSAFGERGDKPGSTWLTAFVVKSFAEAKPYIFIDQADLDKSIAYLKQTQNPEDGLFGCFFESGQVFSSYMQGGLGQKGEDNDAALTAYVLIALLQAGLDKQDRVTVNALECINRELQQQPDIDTYTLALAAYANTLFDPLSHQARNVMDRLNQRAVDDGNVKHWRRQGEQPKPVNSWYYYSAPSAEVEMTAYSLLASLAYYRDDAIAKGQPIAFWLSNQQSAFGGFSSTQDTVVGLNALSEFAALAYANESTNLILSVISQKTKQTFAFSVTPDNTLQLQREQLELSGDTSLVITAEGLGCALVQANVRYNKMPDKLGITDPKFQLQVEPHLYQHDRNKCDHRTLHITFGVRDDDAFSAGMTMLTVRMVTGWSIIPDSLRELQSKFPILGIERHEVNEEEGLLSFYLDELNTRQRRFTLDVQQNRDLAVSDPKEAEVQIYQYYERDMTVIESYGIKTTCGTKAEIPYDDSSLPDDAIPFPVQRRVDVGAAPLNVGESRGESRGPTGPNCPVCDLEKTPANYDALICNSTAVYKVHAGRNKKYSLKIKADLRPHNKLRDINKFANYRMDEGCRCPLLEPPMRSVLILTRRDNILGSTLTMDAKTYVFNLKSDRTLEKKARKAQRKCRIDP